MKNIKMCNLVEGNLSSSHSYLSTCEGRTKHATVSQHTHTWQDLYQDFYYISIFQALVHTQ